MPEGIINLSQHPLQIDDGNLTFHDGGRYHIETSPLICRANQWTGFHMITASVMKELKHLFKKVANNTFFRS